MTLIHTVKNTLQSLPNITCPVTWNLNINNYYVTFSLSKIVQFILLFSIVEFLIEADSIEVNITTRSEIEAEDLTCDLLGWIDFSIKVTGRNITNLPDIEGSFIDENKVSIALLGQQHLLKPKLFDVTHAIKYLEGTYSFEMISKAEEDDKELDREGGGEGEEKKVEGCRFSFSLAVVLGPYPETYYDQSTMVSALSENALRVLIVDDSVLIQKILSNLFRIRGYFVATASNGKEALKLIRKESFDIVFMDFLMPVMNGITTLTLWKEQQHHSETSTTSSSKIRSRSISGTGNNSLKRTPVIIGMSSVMTNENEKVEAFNIGMHFFILKPINELIINGISEVLYSSTDLSSRLEKISLVPGVGSQWQARLEKRRSYFSKNRITPIHSSDDPSPLSPPHETTTLSPTRGSSTRGCSRFFESTRASFNTIPASPTSPISDLQRREDINVKEEEEEDDDSIAVRGIKSISSIRHSINSFVANIASLMEEESENDH